MKKNAHKMKWLLDMLTALWGPGNEQESLLDLLVYIGQNDSYKAIWEEALRSNGSVLSTLDGVAARAIQSTCEMKKSQIRQLCSCLKARLGSAVFCSEYKITQVLGLDLDHIVLTTGSYKYGKEKIDWPYKPVKEVLELWLKSKSQMIEGANGFLGNHLDIVVTIDHGKGRSQIMIGNACCWKDNAEVTMNTFGTLLNDKL
jgi:hypothetical protein